MLWVLRHRELILHRHFLASAGAVVMILALALDPFAQQIVRYYGCTEILGTSEASISKTNLYDRGGATAHIGANTNTVLPGMQSAVNVGVFSPGSTAVLRETVPSSSHITLLATVVNAALCQHN